MARFREKARLVCVISSESCILDPYCGYRVVGNDDTPHHTDSNRHSHSSLTMAIRLGKHNSRNHPGIP